MLHAPKRDVYVVIAAGMGLVLLAAGLLVEAGVERSTTFWAFGTFLGLFVGAAYILLGSYTYEAEVGKMMMVGGQIIPPGNFLFVLDTSTVHAFSATPFPRHVEADGIDMTYLTVPGPTPEELACLRTGSSTRRWPASLTSTASITPPQPFWP
jgi:hypothetical protein